MSRRPATVVAILSVILAACGAGARTTASMLVSPDPSLGPSSLAKETPSPTLLSTPTPAATPEPTPKPSPKSTTVPVPPKPSGLGYDPPSELEGGGLVRLTWQAPRTRGVEIRVYGVTRCLPARGACLQEHTALPDDIRVLLTKAPASKGRVTWYQSWGDWVPIEDDPDWACTTAYLSENGTPFNSVVVAAYSTSGHSKFAIVDPGWLGEAEVCPG